MANRIITSKHSSYEAIRKLGEGFAGEVLEVVEQSSGERRAMKLLKQQAIAEGQLAGFKREFSALTGFHHPHICKVYDFGFAESEGRYFFTVELVEGTNLYPYVERLSLEAKEEIFVQIADALGFIHAAGLVHFDIKGSNVLVSEMKGKAVAKIVDFGLAAPPVDAPDQVVGTVRYMSPEMITKKQAIDYRADLYSLGIVLYRMLAGRYPAQGTTINEALMWHTRHTELDVAPLEERGVPSYLIDVARKLTNRVPAERFSSAPVVIKYIELHSGRSYQKSQRELLTTLAEEGPLVGRADQMYAIKTMIHELAQGKAPAGQVPSVLLLAGPPGIGKTRLLKEAFFLSELSQLETSLVSAAKGGCTLANFRQAVGIKGPDVVDGLLAQEKLFLLVDDLDRAGPEVQDAVAWLAASLYTASLSGAPRPICIIATMTVPTLDAPLPLALVGARDERLRPLGREEIASYISAFLGEAAPPEEQVEDILDFSGGIPELVRTAIASLSSPTAKLPDTRQFFADCIGRLSPSARFVLGCLAMAERALTVGELEKLPDRTAAAGAEELLRSGLVVREVASQSYELAAQAIADAAKAVLSTEETKEIAARLLKMALAAPARDDSAIARYAPLAAPPEEACALLLEAAEREESRQELAASPAHYLQALALMGEADPRTPNIHRKLARSRILASQYDEAKKHLDAAMRRSPPLVQDFMALSWIARVQRRPLDALRHLREGIESARSSLDDVGRLFLMNEEALCHLETGDVARAIELFRQNLEEASALREDQQCCVVNNNLGQALCLAGKYDDAVAFYRKKLELFRDDARVRASILFQLGFVFETSFQLDEALESYQEGWEIASSLGDTHGAAAVLGNIINVCQSLALYSEALSYAKQGLSLASQMSSKRELATMLLRMGSLFINLGLEDAAPRYLEEAEALALSEGDRRLEGWVALSKAYLFKNQGRTGEALPLLEQAAALGEKFAEPDLQIMGRSGATDALLEMGEHAAAAEHLGKIAVPWPGPEDARERDIKIELLRLAVAVQSGEPLPDTTERLQGLASLSGRRGLRELECEAHHTLGAWHSKRGDELSSAEAYARAREIVEEIRRHLSEEYRDSFSRQRFRKQILDDSVRLDQAAVQKGLEEARRQPSSENAAGSAPISDETSASPDGAIGDETKDLSK